MARKPLDTEDRSRWFQTIQDEYAGPLFVFAYRALGDAEDAQDVVQEVLFRAWRGADRYDPERGAASTWLFTIARNVVIDHRRRAQVRPRIVGEVHDDGNESVTDSGAFERALDAWEMAEALRHLTPQHREVIVETYYRDHSVARTAERLGIPAGTVKSRLYHGLRHLRRALEERGVVG